MDTTGHPTQADVEVRLARIKSTSLGPEDHGILTAQLHLDYGLGGQAAGGYDLRSGQSCARFIQGVLDVVRVGRWEDVAGHTVYALADGPAGLVRGLRSLPFDGPEREFWFASIHDEP